MDAFAVAICLGLSLPRLKFRQPITVGLYFGLFQALMPFGGYLLGAQFAGQVAAVDHWLAFVLLGFIGGRMIKNSFAKDCPPPPTSSLGPRRMLPLALATSIDALAVGVSLAFLEVRIVPAISVIGLITFLLAAVGVILGHWGGARYQAKAELAGGIILLLMGLKILLEHLGVF